MKLFQVSDMIWRGSHPETWHDIMDLYATGIKNILNLESGLYELLQADITHETNLAKSHNINFERLKMSYVLPPTYEEMCYALDRLEHNIGPTFIHCWSGVDRTGAIIAAVRVDFFHWPVDEAMEEMQKMGHHWYLKWWDRFIERDLNKLRG